MLLKILLLVAFPCISSAQLGITCYDMGQGNCTLVLHHNYASVELIRKRQALNIVNLSDNGIAVARHEGIKNQLGVPLAAKLIL